MWCKEPRPDRDSLYRRSRALHARYGEARGKARGDRAQARGRRVLEDGRLALGHMEPEQDGRRALGHKQGPEPEQGDRLAPGHKQGLEPERGRRVLVHDILEAGSKVLESMLVEALESIVA